MTPFDEIPIVDRASVSVARERARAVAAEVGMPTVDAERLALAVSELAQNQIDHARGGAIAIAPVRRRGVGGVELLAVDCGPGWSDPAGALAGTEAPKGLGAGLPTVRRMMDELDLDVRQGEWTRIRARRFVHPVPRQPEVVVLGRPVGHPPSGDHALVLRDDESVLLVVFDGLGHGPAARDSADRAAIAVRDHASLPLAELFGVVDRALAGHRGVAMTVSRWFPQERRMELAGCGNVMAWLQDVDGVRERLLPVPAVVGAGAPPPKVRTWELRPRDLLVMFTDGIRSSRVPDTRADAALTPVRVAQSLLYGQAKAHDDALVLVAR